MRNMVLKASSLILVFGMILCLNAPLTANAAITYSAEVSVLLDEVTISGTITGNLSGPEDILLYVMKPGADLSQMTADQIAEKAFHIDSFQSQSNTSFTYTLKMNENDPNGVYSFALNSTSLTTPYIGSSFTFNNKGTREARILNYANKPADQITADSLMSYFRLYRTTLIMYGSGGKAYYDLIGNTKDDPGDAIKRKVCEYIISGLNDYKKPYDEMELVNLLKDAFIMVEFNLKTTTVSELESRLQNYASVLGIDMGEGSDYEIASNLTMDGSLTAKDYALSKMLEEVSSYASFKDIADGFADHLILANVNRLHWNELPAYIKKYNSKFNYGESGRSGYDYDKLFSDDQKYLELKQYWAKLMLQKREAKGESENEDERYYNTFEEFTKDAEEAFEAAWDKYKNKIEKDDNNGSGGGSSSGKSGGGSNVVIQNPPVTKPETKPTETVIPANERFSDVDGVEWAWPSIALLAQKGIVVGRPDRKFAPNDPILREEFIKMLMGALGLTDSSLTTAVFMDVPANEWYTAPIASAQKYGITNGRGDGSFGLGDEITREEMALFAYRAAKVAGIEFKQVTSPINFTDFDLISDYALEPVITLQTADIIKGMEDGSFSGASNATRAQAAVIIGKLLDLKGNK